MSFVGYLWCWWSHINLSSSTTVIFWSVLKRKAVRWLQKMLVFQQMVSFNWSYYCSRSLMYYWEKIMWFSYKQDYKHEKTGILEVFAHSALKCSCLDTCLGGRRPRLHQGFCFNQLPEEGALFSNTMKFHCVFSASA